MRVKSSSFLALLFAFLHARSQVSIPASGFVSEKFNSMANGTALPPGWLMSAASAGATANWSTAGNITAVTQVASGGSPTSGGAYNWGTSAGTDRAIGFMTSGSYASENSILAFYRNETGEPITSLTVAFQIERYRTNTTAFTLSFFSSIDGNTWVPGTAGDISTASFPTGTNAYSFGTPPPLTIYKTVTINGLSIANNGEFYLRWLFTNTQNTNSQGLGLDNVSLNVNTTGPIVAASLVDALSNDVNNNGKTNEGDNITYTATIGSTKDTARNVQYNATLDPNTSLSGFVRSSALANNDDFSTPLNTQLSGQNVLVNDFGLPSLSVISFGPTETPVATAAGGTGSSDNGGTVVLNGDGTLTYTPPIGFVGNDRFSYVTEAGVIPDDVGVVTIAVGIEQSAGIVDNFSGAQAQISTAIGTISKNKSVKIVYEVTVANILSPANATQISQQGTVTGSNFSSVLTDDPDAGGAADPTITLIDLPPSVVSIDRQSPSTKLTNATSVVYRVTFSENVNNVDIDDFGLNTISTVAGTIASVSSSSGMTIDVTVNSITGDGDLRLDLNANGTGIVDDESNPITNGFTKGQVYTFDHVAPAVTINQAATQIDPASDATIHFTVLFNEPVSGFTNDDVTLSTGTGATAVVVSQVAQDDDTVYDVAVTGMTSDGTVIVFIAAGKAIDAAGNSNTSSTSADNTVSWISCKVVCPNDITVETDAGGTQCGAHVTFGATTTGNCGTVTYVDQNNSPVSSGDFFPVGTTIVTASTNAGQCSFLVTVNDITPPRITCPAPMQGSVDKNCQAAVPNFVSQATAMDNCTASNSITITQSPLAGTLVGAGTTTVTLTATDASGNHATCRSAFTVVDNTAPGFTTTLSATPIVLWPPDHFLKDVMLTYTTTDNCPGTVTNNIIVTSTDPITGVSDGDKFPDWVVIDDHHLYLRAERGNGRDARMYTITVTPVDASGNHGTAQSVDIYVAHNITAPLTGASFRVGSTVNFAGAFWDKPGNSHIAQWLVDDNTMVKGSVAEPSGAKNGKVTSSYRFSSTGIYRLQMNVTDQNKMTSYVNTNEDLEEIVVIYDPNGGYAYGGGWFNSPYGALAADKTATGKVSYGFSVNYYKGATFPKGEAQFEFKAGSFQYNALNFDYLSVAGCKAVFAGSGKIVGGQSGINFTMYVIDGALDGSGIDRVRFKIYNKNTGYVYYDNEPGSGDAANPVTPVGINSTVVITGAPVLSGQKAITYKETARQLDVRAVPNPTNTSFRITVKGDQLAGVILMQVVDMYGRTVELRKVAAGGTIQLGDRYRPGTYTVKLSQGEHHEQLKLIKLPD